MLIAIAGADDVWYCDLATQQSQGIPFLHRYDPDQPNPPSAEEPP